MLTLPADLRHELKAPFGPVYTDAEALLRDAGRPIVTVGDVVTYHLREAGHDPKVAVVDGITKREEISDEVRAVVDEGEVRVAVENAPAELSREMLVALREAVAREDNTRIAVDGEEDLVTLPAVLVTPIGGSVVYGQPGEGMVLVEVTDESRAAMRDLLSTFEGDVAAAFDLLDG
jgi:uncharacterized protein (UPF0218 family)